jgi:hypothetical protein
MTAVTSSKVRMGLTSANEKWTEVSSYKRKRRGFYRGETN